MPQLRFQTQHVGNVCTVTMHDLAGNDGEERPCDGPPLDVDLLTQPVLPCRKAFPGDPARIRGEDGKDLLRPQRLSHRQGCIIRVSERSVNREFQHWVGTYPRERRELLDLDLGGFSLGNIRQRARDASYGLLRGQRDLGIDFYPTKLPVAG